MSHRGAKLCVSKRKKAAEFVEMDANVHVVVPFQPKNFREPKPSSKETQFVKVLISASAVSSTIEFRRGKMLKLLMRQKHRSILQWLVSSVDSMLQMERCTSLSPKIAMKTSDDDPTLIRQKILRHAYKAEEEGNLINAAYSQTQPVNVLGNLSFLNLLLTKIQAEHKTLEDEDAEFNQPMWKRMKYQDDKKKGKIVVDEEKLV